MPKPNIFDFNATGSSWDPDVSASISLTPEVSESIRILNKTIANYVGIDHDLGSDSIEFIRESIDGDDANYAPIFSLNLKGGIPETVNFGYQPVIMEVKHDDEVAFDVEGFGYTDNNFFYADDDKYTIHPFHKHGIVNIYNKPPSATSAHWSGALPTSSSGFLKCWNIMSRSIGIISESAFSLGTINDRPVFAIGTNSPSASLHISSSITGSVTDLLRIQNDFGVPIFKVKPDRIIIRNSGSSANEATMSVDSNNNLMFNDVIGINHNHMFIKSGSKRIKLEVGATSGDLKFRRISDGRVLMRVREADTGSIFTEGDILAEGYMSSSWMRTGLLMTSNLASPIYTVGSHYVLGDVTASKFQGDGSGLTNVTASSGMFTSGSFLIGDERVTDGTYWSHISSSTEGNSTANLAGRWGQYAQSTTSWKLEGSSTYASLTFYNSGAPNTKITDMMQVSKFPGDVRVATSHGVFGIGTDNPVTASIARLTVSGSISASGAIYGGSSSTEIVSGSGQVLSGWHGSQTRIKILPKDFFPNDDYDRGGIEATDAVIGQSFSINVSNANLEMYASIVIPQGYKATGIKIAGTDTDNRVQAFEACVVGCVIVALIDQGLGDPTRYVGTEYDFDTEMVAGVTNYLLVKVSPTATDDLIYGGYINIEKINS